MVFCCLSTGFTFLLMCASYVGKAVIWLLGLANSEHFFTLEQFLALSCVGGLVAEYFLTYLSFSFSGSLVHLVVLLLIWVSVLVLFSLFLWDFRLWIGDFHVQIMDDGLFGKYNSSSNHICTSDSGKKKEQIESRRADLWDLGVFPMEKLNDDISC